MAVTTTETGYITGTADKDYNIIWFTEACLSNALRLEVYIQDAERPREPLSASGPSTGKVLRCFSHGHRPNGSPQLMAPARRSTADHWCMTGRTTR